MQQQTNLEHISADDLSEKMFYVHIRVYEPELLNRV